MVGVRFSSNVIHCATSAEPIVATSLPFILIEMLTPKSSLAASHAAWMPLSPMPSTKGRNASSPSLSSEALSSRSARASLA